MSHPGALYCPVKTCVDLATLQVLLVAPGLPCSCGGSHHRAVIELANARGLACRVCPTHAQPLEAHPVESARVYRDRLRDHCDEYERRARKLGCSGFDWARARVVLVPVELPQNLVIIELSKRLDGVFSSEERKP